jgi:hypothetical protein
MIHSAVARLGVPGMVDVILVDVPKIVGIDDDPWHGNALHTALECR